MKQGREIKKLGEVAIFVNGDRGKNYPSQHDFVDDGVPFINAGHLVGGSIDFASMNYISEEKYNQLGAGKIVNGDILFCLRGSLGKRAIVKDVNYGAIASSLVIIRSKNVLLNRYLFHYLGSQTVQNLITKNDNGSSQPNLSAKSVSDFSIPIPSWEEQERIVEELDCLSGVIENKREQLKELDALALSIFYQMFGDPITNEKGWEVKKLGEVCDVRDGTHDSPKYLEYSDYMLITSKNITADGNIDFSTANYISKQDYDAINKRSYVDDGDIIMAMIGTIGKPIIVRNTNKMFCIKNVALIKFGGSAIVLNTYIQALLSNPSYGLYIQSLNKGGTQKFIALGTIRTLPTPCPPINLQQEFADKIEAIEKQKELIKKSISETETLFNARMDYYFN